MDNTIKLEDLAVAAYAAYCETRNWKSYDGKPLPYWPDAREDIKDGWRKAAEAIVWELREKDFHCEKSVEGVDDEAARVLLEETVIGFKEA